MCGRFDCHSTPEMISAEFQASSQAIADYIPSYNIAPSSPVIIVKSNGERRFIQCRWGFLPSWAKDESMGYKLINARAETVAEKPAFKDAFSRQRCLVVADGFYEWVKEGKVRRPFYIHLKSQRPMGFAGLYNNWRSPDGKTISTCTLITTTANALVRPLHDRMPVIIMKDKENAWLDQHTHDGGLLMALLRPYASEEMESYEVSVAVNKPGNDGPEIIAPVN